MRRLLLIFALLLIAPAVRAQIVSTPGWHKIPSTALCGGGSESNAAYTDPDNFPANLSGLYTSYGFGFTAQCVSLMDDSNSAAYDYIRHRMLIYGGGHQHYWGDDIFSLEMSLIGSSPVLYHLYHSANPNGCPSSGTPSSIVTEANGAVCQFNSGGTLTSVLGLPQCNWNGTAGSGCAPTQLTLPASTHNYNTDVYVPPFVIAGVQYGDLFFTAGAAAPPNGNNTENAWTLSMPSVLYTCSPTLGQPGCNPTWTPLGTTASNNFIPDSLGVGRMAAWDPNQHLIWLQTQSGLFSWSPVTPHTLTTRSGSGTGYHSTGVIDPIDQYFIFIGPCWNSTPANGASGCGAAGDEGINYVSIASGSTFTFNHPSTTGCSTIVSNFNGTSFPPASQYQGVVWDPIAKQVRIYPNGTNTVWLLDPKTWICTSETYGTTQGTDYPQNTPINFTGTGGDEGTYGHFAYDPGYDAFILMNDGQNDAWYLRTRHATDILCNGTWSNGTCTGGSPQTNTPVSISKAFRDGDFPACVLAYQDSSGAAISVTTQNDVQNRWPDGSLKKAVISLVIPSMAASQVVRVNYDVQSCPSNAGFLTAANMLSTSSPNWNFDAQLQLTGTASHNISARTILSAANSGAGCAAPTSGDIDGKIISGSLCTYWLQGPIVTAVILTDGSTARSYDVNTDGNTGNPLHPIFECWFWPQTTQVQCGYTLENAWASTTATSSARDQMYSLVLTGGLTSPVTMTAGWGTGSQTMLTRTVFHRTFCLNGTANTCSPVTIDHDWPYLSQTKFTPYWDPSIKMNSTYVSNFTTAFNNAGTNKSLVGSSAGIGFYPGTTSCGNSNTSTTGDQCSSGGFNQTGAGYFHGPLTTWEITCLLTFDPGICGTVTIGNSDLGYEIPYFYREADTSAGHGGWFDAGNSNAASPTAGTIGTFGRIVSINARTQLNMQDATIQGGTCNTSYAADWVNYGGAGQDLGVFSGQTNSAHWANLAYVSYLITGQYAYYEEQVMQAAFAVGLAGDYSPGSRACYQPTANGSLRMGAAGYWEVDQERGNDWQGRENVLGAFIALDGSPEKAYLTDKVNMNLAVWEGAHNITFDIVGTGKTYPYGGGSGFGASQSAWSYGNTSRILNNNAGGTLLGSWAIGPATGAAGYASNEPLCYGNTTAPCPAVQFSNPPFGANSNFQNSYSGLMIGWINDLGYCPSTCSMLGYVANHYINEAVNPVASPFDLAEYVYPTLDNTGNQITTWTQDQTFYYGPARLAAFPSANPGSGFDENYVSENASAMSYLVNLTSSQGGYSGQAAYNVIDSEGREPLITNFNVCAVYSPKWCIVPRTVVFVAPASSPAVSFGPSSLVFGGQVVTTTSAQQIVTLTNTGTASLTISSVTLTGAAFALATPSSGSDCRTIGTVAPSATCNIAVTFTPTVGGPASGSVSVASNAPGSPNAFSITGTGLVISGAGNIFGTGTIKGAGTIKP